MNDLPVTPMGTVVYARVNEPNFNALSNRDEYYITVKFLPGKVEPLKQTLEAQLQDYYTTKVKNKALVQKGHIISPFKTQAGEETGELMMQFKAAAYMTKKNGELMENPIALFNRAGEPIREEVYGGAKVLVTYKPYFWEKAGIGYGMSLQLKAVQVAVPSKGRDINDAASWGFSPLPEEESFDENSEIPF